MSPMLFCCSLSPSTPPLSSRNCLCPLSHSLYLLPSFCSCYLSVCAPLSQDCEQVTVVERGGPPGSSMQGTDGPPCPFSKTVNTGYSIKMHMMYFNPSFLLELTAKLVHYCQIMLCVMSQIHGCHCQHSSFFSHQLPVSWGTDFYKTFAKFNHLGFQKTTCQKT